MRRLSPRENGKSGHRPEAGSNGSTPVDTGKEALPPLPAKLLRPKHGNAITRPRLLRWLSRKGAAPVTWIHAPAGSGKTFLLTAYTEQRGTPSLWYEVDASDRDISTVFHQLALASEHLLAKRLGLPVWQPGTPIGLEGFARRFFSQLFARLPSGCCVVFDNYQEAANRPEWHVIFREMIAARPPYLRLCIASRQGAPSIFSRFKVSGELETIGFDALMLDAREIKTMLRQRGAPTGDSEALHRSTGGWAVAVSLLAGALRDRRPARSQKAHRPARSAQATTAVFEFLAAEILERLDPKTRAFLLDIAIFPHFDREMAASLTQRDDAALLLDRLERDQLLLDRHEDGRYRVHDLFRAFLLEHGRVRQSPDDRRRLAASAAALLAQHGDFDVASDLLADARAWPALVELIERQAPALAAQGRMATIAAAIVRIPDTERVGHPWLDLWSATSGLGRNVDARALAERAFADFRATSDLVGEMLAWTLVVQSMVVEGNDFRELERWLRILREVPAGVLPPAVATRVAFGELMAWGHAGVAYDDELRRRTGRALDLVRSHGSTEERVVATAFAAIQCCFAGETTRSQELLDYGEQELANCVAEPLARLLHIHASVLISFSAFGRLRETAQVVTHALELSEKESVPLLDSSLLVLGASAALAVGDLQQGRKLLTRMNRGTAPRTRNDRAAISFVRAWEALERGDFETARAGLTETIGEVEQLGFRYARYHGAFGELILASLSRDEAETRRCIADVKGRLKNVPWPQLAAAGTLALAHAKLCLGEPAVVELRAGMQLGRAASLIGSGFFGQKVIARLTTAALSHGIEPEYAIRLVRAYEIPPAREALLLPAWPWQVRVRALGTLEIEVDGRVVEFGRKLPTVPLTLLKLLVAALNPVPTSRVLGALWPGQAAEASRGSLDTAVYRLRKLLGHDDAVRHSAGALSLNFTLCWTDVRVVDFACTELEALPAERRHDSDATAASLRRALMDAYRGAPAAASDPRLLSQLWQRLELRVSRVRGHVAPR